MACLTCPPLWWVAAKGTRGELECCLAMGNPAACTVGGCQPSLVHTRRQLHSCSSACMFPFPFAQVEKKLLKAGVVQPPEAPKDDSDDEGAQQRARTMRGWVGVWEGLHG